MTITLPADARSRLDAHLDAVEGVLHAAGRPREQRRAVTDDLEAQIMDMLAAQSAAPTLGDLEAVLARLDPPAAYAADRAGLAPVAGPSAPVAVVAAPRPRYSRTAIWGLVCILVSFLPALLIIPVGFLLVRRVEYTGSTTREAMASDVAMATRVSVPAFGQTSTSAPPLEAATSRAAMPPIHFEAAERQPNSASFLAKPLICVAIPVAPLGLLGTILGWIAFVQIRRSRGALTGTGLALFDGLFYPVTFLILAVFLI